MDLWQPLQISLELAAITSLLLLLISAPLAFFLAKLPKLMRIPILNIIALPIVLPPTVLGFYLLLLLSPNSEWGQMIPFDRFGIKPFSFSGLVLASAIYSLPFMFQPIYQAVQSIPVQLKETAMTLGARPFNRFVTVYLPYCRHGIINGFLLAFAHTLGEFGVILMIGGSIPGETKVASIAIFDFVESFQFDKAHQLSAVMLVIAFTIMCLTSWISTDKEGQV